MRRSTAILALASIAPLLLAGCNDDDNNPVAPVEDAVPAPTFTDTFEGSLELGDTSCHFYTSIETGDAELTVTDLQPLATLTVGLAIGIPDDTAASGCVSFAEDRSVRVGDVLLSQNLLADNYCVCVLDVGNIFEDQTVTYEISVTHT